MMEELTREELLAAVDAVAADLLAAAGVHQPPVDAVKIAWRHLGLALSAGSSRRGCGGRQSAEAGDGDPDRQQWLAAQVVGDHLKPRVMERLGVPTEASRAMLGESVANLFAFRLLLPTPWFREAARACEYDLFALKAQFSTAGHDVLAWRMLDLDEPCIVTIHDNGSIVRRKGNAFRPPKTLSRAESECLAHIREYSRPCEVSADGWRVQGWPVHTVDWRREILRSVVDEEAMRGDYAE
jgi:hypothetical protein